MSIELIHLALSESLDRLVVAHDQVMPSGDVVHRWGIADGDRLALSRWGLPIIEETRFIANIQESASPELVVRDRPFYALGLFADHDMGLEPEAGPVWGFALEDGQRDVLINSSAAKLVESSWRWYWVWKAVRGLRYDIEQYDLLDRFLAFVVDLDPQVGSSPASMWRGLIETW